jgi:predicted Zn-dependent peptidase
MNANTGKEHTQYYIKAQSSYLTLIFEVLTDMIQNSLLSEEELEREKGVIVEEINMYKDVPMAEVDNILDRIMWLDSPLGQDIAGTKETVTKFTREMFAGYLKRHYQPGNIIVGISGKYKPDQIQFLLEKYWTEVKNHPVPKWKNAKVVQKQPVLEVKYKDTQQAHLGLGFRGLDFEDKRNNAATVLSAILGGGMSSRLFYEVRERRGLAYYIRSASNNYQDTGSFTISAGIQVDKIDQAIEVILQELKRICDFAVNPKELAKAKEYIKGKTTLALEDNQARLDWFLEQEAFHKEIQTPSEFFADIEEVSAKQVEEVAKDLFQSKNANLAVLGPYKSDKNFAELLQKHL